MMVFDRHSKAALVVAILTLAVCGIGFRYGIRALNAYLQKEPVPLRDQLRSIPKRLGSWQAIGEDGELTVELEEALGTPHYLDRGYALDTGGRVRTSLRLHIAYYTGMIDAVPHVPDRCLEVAGLVKMGLPTNLDLHVDRTDWREDPEDANVRRGERYPILTFSHHVTGRPVTVHMPNEKFQLRTQEFRIKHRPDMPIYAGYLFIANGKTTPWPERVRLLAFQLKEKYAYYAKVQFTMYAAADIEPDDFVKLVSDLLAELLPELMRCLPDWAEVESWSHAPSTNLDE